jgi:hypothetical protein
MARTRTSDPGRVEALHYAATPGQRHAKRLVYAYLWLIGLRAVGLEAASQVRLPDASPCVACQAFSLTPTQVPELPDRLAGTRVLLRLAPGATAAEWSPALQELRRRGGAAGLHVTGIPADEDPALAADADILLVEVGAGDPDRRAFDLKRALTLVRGRRPATTLLIAAAPETAAALRQRGMDPYVDGFVPVPSVIRTAEELLTPG